jgi:glycosyltransferase involved in cell wall biosynthesis
LAEGRFSAQEASLYARKNDEVDMAEKIVKLLDSPKLRKKMGVFGRNRILNTLEWKYESPKFLHAYEVLFKE